MKTKANIEYELGPNGQRTGRWRARQYYALVRDTRVPSKRTRCEWRAAKP